MALKKEIETSNGASGDYIRITSVSETNIDYEIWLNRETRQDKNKTPLSYGSSPISDPSIFTEENLKKSGNTVKSVSYEYLKTLEQFSGSMDV